MPLTMQLRPSGAKWSIQQNVSQPPPKISLSPSPMQFTLYLHKREPWFLHRRPYLLFLSYQEKYGFFIWMYSISNIKDTLPGKTTQVLVLLIQIQSLHNKFQLLI